MAHEYFGAPSHLRNAAAAPSFQGAKLSAAAEAQARCDAIQAEYRATATGSQRRSIRRDPPPLPPALVPTDDPLRQRLAEELEYARRMIEQMGDELCGDAAVVMRHSVALQAIDIVGQMLGHIANVTRSSDPLGAVERIGMCDLKARLLRKGGL